MQTFDHQFKWRLFVLLILVVVAVWLPAQEAPQLTRDAGEVGVFVRPIARLTVDIATHSGSPLLLELTIPDPEHVLTAVSVESAVSFASYVIPPDHDRESATLTFSPFLRPGIYDLRVAMEAQRDGLTVEFESSAEIGFVDFVFGRDNLRFGNNNDYVSVIGTFGEILSEWVDTRFGGVSDDELVPLVDHLYRFFGNRAGRCYAFAGSQFRFWKWPDLLPRYFDETYDFRPGVPQTQRDMNFLQLDMAFDHFLVGGNDLSGLFGAGPSDGHQAMLDEVSAIVSRIRTGDPVVVGFTGPDLHHAMLVYGFIQGDHGSYIDLLVANNWKSDEDSNLRSKDAEAVRVFLDPQEEPLVEWRYAGGTRKDEIDRFYIVDVKHEYNHDRAYLDRFLNARVGQLSESRRALVVVEGAKAAWLTDGERSTGYVGYRTREEIDDVLFDKTDRTFRFEYPADGDLWLELDDDQGSRILHFHPGEVAGSEFAWVQETPVPEEESTVQIRVSLGTSEAQWQPVIEADE